MREIDPAVVDCGPNVAEASLQPNEVPAGGDQVATGVLEDVQRPVAHAGLFGTSSPASFLPRYLSVLTVAIYPMQALNLF
jgi:hypothetical protein